MADKSAISCRFGLEIDLETRPAHAQMRQFRFHGYGQRLRRRLPLFRQRRR